MIVTWTDARMQFGVGRGSHSCAAQDDPGAAFAFLSPELKMFHVKHMTLVPKK
jgi:hypothetical protein